MLFFRNWPTHLHFLAFISLATLWPSAIMAQQTPPSTPGTPIPVSPTTPGALPGLDNLDPNPSLEPTNPNDLRPLSQGNSLLSIKGGERLMNEASTAISSQNYSIATQKLQEARQVFNQLSNFYTQLSSSFAGIDNRLAEVNRDRALSTAQMRDTATYQLALVHRSQNQPDLAVPLLIQIIRSQAPTRDLGKKAYQQLLELGFVDTPYPRPSTQSNSPKPN